MSIVMVYCSAAAGVLVAALMVCSRSAWHPTEACATSAHAYALLLSDLLLIDVFVASLLTSMASLSSVAAVPGTVSSTCEPTVWNALVHGVSLGAVDRTSIRHEVLIEHVGLIFNHIWLDSVAFSLRLLWLYSVGVQVWNIDVISDLVTLILPVRQIVRLIVPVRIQFEIQFEPVIEHDTTFLFDLLIIMHYLHLISFQFSQLKSQLSATWINYALLGAISLAHFYHLLLEVFLQLAQFNFSSILHLIS